MPITETIAMGAWVSIIQSIAVIGILVVALGLTVGAVQPANALKSMGAILGATVALILLPRLIIGAWDGLPGWEKISATDVLLIFWTRRRIDRHPREHPREWLPPTVMDVLRRV